jgi:hypothetical protein
MLFTIHDDAGQISASTKIYDPEHYKDYSARLDAMGHKHVAVKGMVPHHHEMVFVRNGEIVARPALPAKLSKSVIKADDKDTAELTGLPNPCRVVVSAAGMTLEDQMVTDGGICITSQVPTTYTILVYAFPYKRASFTVEARA